MKFLNRPIAYLQNDDFDSNGVLTNPKIPKNKTVLIMIQAGYCGYCTQAKPAFQEFANNNKNIFCATIQGDGTMPGEQELGKRIKTISPGFRGYPDYVKYISGKRVSGDIKGRGVKDLIEFTS